MSPGGWLGAGRSLHWQWPLHCSSSCCHMSLPWPSPSAAFAAGAGPPLVRESRGLSLTHKPWSCCPSLPPHTQEHRTLLTQTPGPERRDQPCQPTHVGSKGHQDAPPRGSWFCSLPQRCPCHPKHDTSPQDFPQAWGLCRISLPPHVLQFPGPERAAWLPRHVCPHWRMLTHTHTHLSTCMTDTHLPVCTQMLAHLCVHVHMHLHT